jgi:hypothetical protein
MTAMMKTYVTFRALRWLTWIAYLIYCLAFLADRSSHLNQFGHLIITTELVLFGLPTAAIFLGFFEMMTRERAGLAKPTLGQLLPGKDTQPKLNQFAGR